MVIDKIFKIDGMLAEKIDRKEFDSRMEKFSSRNLDIISSMKTEILKMKKEHVEFEKRFLAAFGCMEANILQNVEDKILEDESWASVVRRNVDEKLLNV